MQNFRITITVLHSKNEIMSVFSPIEHCCLLSFCYSKMPFFHIKHEKKLKRKQNVALYNPHDLNDAYQLKCLTYELMSLMHKQHSTATVNLVTLYFQRSHQINHTHHLWLLPKRLVNQLWYHPMNITKNFVFTLYFQLTLLLLSM